MRLLKQTKPQCLLYSAAMLLDETPECLVQEIGHDGLALTNPELPEPLCYRGVMIQEIQLCCFRRRKCLAPICDVVEAVYGNDERRSRIQILPATALSCLTARGRGLILTTRHSVAFETGIIYDPKGFSEPIAIRHLLDSEVWFLGVIGDLGFGFNVR